MKVLIVGGTSSIALALKPLLSEFSEVVTAGRSNCDLKLEINDDLDNIFLPDGFDVVIHTAAAFGGKSALDMLHTENTNVLGTLKLCAATANANVSHFILISSIFAKLSESSSFYSAYALSKKHGEEIARLFCSTHALPLTILQPAQLYGDTDSFRKHQPFIYSIADKAQHNEDILLFGNHDAKRNFLHIDDLAKIIAQVIKVKPEGTFACTQTSDVSFSQIANAAISAFQSKSKITFLLDKADVPDNVFDHDHAIYQRIGYLPSINIEEGMKRIAKHRKQST